MLGSVRVRAIAQVPSRRPVGVPFGLQPGSISSDESVHLGHTRLRLQWHGGSMVWVAHGVRRSACGSEGRNTHRVRGRQLSAPAMRGPPIGLWCQFAFW